MILDDDGALEILIDVTEIIVDQLSISIETFVGYASYLNGNNEQHKITIHKMVREVLIDRNKHGENGIMQQKHQMNYINAKIQSTLDKEPTHFSQHEKRNSINELI